MGCAQGKTNQRQREHDQAPQTQRARTASGHEDRTWRILALSISSSESTVICLNSAPSSIPRKGGLPLKSYNVPSLSSLGLCPGLTSASSLPSSNPRADADRILPRNSSLRPNPLCHQRVSPTPSLPHQEASMRGVLSTGEPSALSTSSGSSSPGKSS
jgi:hypothetical protein